MLAAISAVLVYAKSAKLHQAETASTEEARIPEFFDIHFAAVRIAEVSTRNGLRLRQMNSGSGAAVAAS